jgi:F0F1-type ATP synthase gamma subunit
MKYVKTFENFQSVNEEEGVFGAIGGFFGKYNEDTRKRAEEAIAEYGEKKPTSVIVSLFNKFKEAYDNNTGLTLEASNLNTFKYPEMEVTNEEVKKIFEDICVTIRLNEATAWGLGLSKEGKLEVFQSKSYSATTHGFGSGVAGH